MEHLRHRPIARLVQLGRVSLDLDDAETVRVLKSIRVWPVDLEVAKRLDAARLRRGPRRRADRGDERGPQRAVAHPRSKDPTFPARTPGLATRRPALSRFRARRRLPALAALDHDRPVQRGLAPHVDVLEVVLNGAGRRFRVVEELVARTRQPVSRRREHR